MSKQVFSYVITKRNGDVRRGHLPKINHALAKFWRVRDVREGTLTAINEKSEKFLLFLKLGKRRGYNCHFVDTQGISRPILHPDVSEKWRRMPTRWNDIT